MLSRSRNIPNTRGEKSSRTRAATIGIDRIGSERIIDGVNSLSEISNSTKIYDERGWKRGCRVFRVCEFEYRTVELRTASFEERIHLYATARSTINALKYAWTRMQTRTNTCSTIKLEAKGAIHVVTPFVAFPVSVIRPNNFLAFPIGRALKNVSIEVDRL